MKLKTNILFSLLLCGTFATAQNLRLDILPPSVTLRQDSAVISMKMTFGASQMDSKSHICLTPILTDGEHSEELPGFCSMENVHTGCTAALRRSTNGEAKQMSLPYSPPLPSTRAIKASITVLHFLWRNGCSKPA